MYGYLKCFLPNMTKNEHQLLRRYYCSTCLSIKKNYGFFNTLILSYDLTILPIVLDIYDYTIKNHSKCHYTSLYGKLDSELWKPIAALNLAIVEQKVIDALSDEKSFFKNLGYKFIRTFIRGGLKKAKKDFPLLFEKASLGMQNVIKVEKNQGDLLAQGNAFAEMIIDSIESFYTLDTMKKEFIKGISIWLCFMDAIDDFDKDLKKNVYNPLRYTNGLISSTKKQLINNKYLEISKYCDLVMTMVSKLQNQSKNSEINSAIDIYIKKILIYQTTLVLNKR